MMISRRTAVHAAMTALNGRPLQSDVDAAFVEIVGRLGMIDVAAFGSAALADD